MDSSTVELIYDQDCPNLAACREVLRSAFTQAGVAPAWREWDRNSPETPAQYRGFGSPTVLIDGRDISAQQHDAVPAGNSCRVYAGDDGRLRGTPSVTSIASALVAHGETAPDSGTEGVQP